MTTTNQTNTATTQQLIHARRSAKDAAKCIELAAKCVGSTGALEMQVQLAAQSLEESMQALRMSVPSAFKHAN